MSHEPCSNYSSLTQIRYIKSYIKTELQSALIDLGHKNAFDLLLKEAWNPEQAAMGNSTLPTVCDKLNVMAAIHNRKLIAALVRELREGRDN